MGAASIESGEARLLCPSDRGVSGPDAAAAGHARALVDRAMDKARTAAQRLIYAVNEVRHMDRDGYLDVAVHRLSLREDELDGALVDLQEAIADTAALTRRQRARDSSGSQDFLDEVGAALAAVDPASFVRTTAEPADEPPPPASPGPAARATPPVSPSDLARLHPRRTPPPSTS